MDKKTLIMARYIAKNIDNPSVDEVLKELSGSFSDAEIIEIKKEIEPIIAERIKAQKFINEIGVAEWWERFNVVKEGVDVIKLDDNILVGEFIDYTKFGVVAEIKGGEVVAGELSKCGFNSVDEVLKAIQKYDEKYDEKDDEKYDEKYDEKEVKELPDEMSDEAGDYFVGAVEYADPRDVIKNAINNSLMWNDMEELKAGIKIAKKFGLYDKFKVEFEKIENKLRKLA